MIKRKTRGGVFAKFQTVAYLPRGFLVGQGTDDSCVPACTRMLICDLGPQAKEQIEFSESYLRIVFDTDASGSSLKMIPKVLEQAGLDNYLYRNNLTFDELKQAIQRGFAIARVAGNKPFEGHAIIVESIDDDFVAIRDPLPLGTGSAYKVSVQDFLEAWRDQKTSLGRAVIMIK